MSSRAVSNRAALWGLLALGGAAHGQALPAAAPPLATWAVGLGGLAGGLRPDADSLRPQRYAGGCLGLARCWRRAATGQPGKETTLALGGRLALAQGRVAGGSDYHAWGLNVYGASDGPWFGAALGLWAGQLGRYREAGRGPVRALPQLRVRGGELGGWHGVLDFGQEAGSVANPTARLLVGRGWAGGRGWLRLGGATSAAQTSVGAAGAAQHGGRRWRAHAEGVYGGPDFYQVSAGVEAVF